MATIVSRSGQFSWSRDFYALDVVGQNVQIKIVSLNFIERFFRMVLGWYQNTIWNQAKIDQIAKANAPQVKKIKTFVSNLNALRPLAPLKTEKLPLASELRLRNIMVVGRTRTGKSTATQGLGDYTKIAPASSIFAKTEEPEVKDIEIIPGATLHIVDTPGLYEVRNSQTIRRTNEELTELTQRVVQAKFQGEGFQNVGRVVFTCTTIRNINQEEMETIFTYDKLLVDGQEKILLITHTEENADDMLQSIKDQVYDHPQFGGKLKTIFGDNVFFIGALTKEMAELSEAQVMTRMRNRIIPRKESLLKRLVQGIVTDDAAEQYCRGRREAFEANKADFLKSLEPYRKPAELRKLIIDLKTLLKGELQNQHIVTDQEKRTEYEDKLYAFIGSSDGFPALKHAAVLLLRFLDDDDRQKIDAIEQDPKDVPEEWKEAFQGLFKELKTYRMTQWLEQLEKSEPYEKDLLSFVEKAQNGNFTPLFRVRYNVLLIHHYMKQNNVDKALPFADAVYKVFYSTTISQEEKGELNQLLELCKQYTQFEKQINDSLSVLNPQ